MNFALRIPDYYKQDIEALKGEVSINQFIINAVAEKIATLKTIKHLEKRASRGSREHALDVLAKVADVEPDERDQLPTNGI
jgi:hypothetical protein